jgi:hypothetical protein
MFQSAGERPAMTRIRAESEASGAVWNIFMFRSENEQQICDRSFADWNTCMFHWGLGNPGLALRA